MKFYTLTRYKKWHNEFVYKVGNSAVFLSKKDAYRIMDKHQELLKQDPEVSSVCKVSTTLYYFDNKGNEFAYIVEECNPIPFKLLIKQIMNVLRH